MTLTPDQQSSLEKIAQTFNEAVTPVFASFKAALSNAILPEPTQSDYVLTGPDLPLLIKSTTAEDIAKVFDVPPELIAPSCVNQVGASAPEGELLSYGIIFPNIWKTVGHMNYDDLAELMQTYDESNPPAGHWSDPASDPLGTVQAAVEFYKQATPLSPITQVAIDLAVHGDAYMALHEDGTISSVPPEEVTITGNDHIHWEHPGTPPVTKHLQLSNHAWGTAMDFDSPVGKPIPGAMYLEGDGDPGVGYSQKISFSVFDNTQPLPSPQPTLKIWKNELGQIDQQGPNFQVSLYGIVSTAHGEHEIGAQIVLTDLELAKRLIGVIPNDGPGTGMCVLEQAAGGQLFTWEAGTGWIPKPDYGPFHACLPEFSVKKGGVKFPTFPEPLPDGDPDAPYGWWCCYHEEHFNDPAHLAGDPVACDAYAQPATSYQHKKMLLKKA